MKKSDTSVATPPATAAPTGDAALVERAQRGDGDAYGQLVVKYQDLVYNAVYRMVGSETDASDIAQEAFVKGWKALGSFEGRAQFGTWIYRIAINCCISDRRGLKRRKATSLNSSAGGGEDEGGMDVADDAPEPAERLVENENVRLVQEAIGELEHEFRTMIVLRDMEGRPYEEIAEVLDVPVGTVRSRLHRARQALKDRLKGKLKEGGR
ncbi:MAG: sigma-70 family RNA polymerase sigma factor [Planctomycetia bacterium]|nr:sigma-70 family RNA polymerase sigma factor [Planctomycetia bacterium]